MHAASTVNGGYIYFDEYNSGYTGASDMQFWIGHSSYSSAYSMSKITNTKLWYISATGWSDATYFAFTSGCNGWGAADEDYYSRIGSNTWKSAKKESYTLNSGNYYVFKAASTANKAAVGSDSPYGHQGTGYSSLNKGQTFKVQVTTNGGSSYANPSTAPASVTFTSKTFSSYTACGTASSGSITAGNATTAVTKNAGYTATTKLEYSSMSSDYTFVCWHDGSNSVGTSTSYTYYPTAATTITARFTKNFTVGDVLYLKPNADWKKDGARFAAYFFGTSSNTWVDCSRVGESDYWTVTVPSGNWGYVIFCRMDGSKAANNFDNAWNQTANLMSDASHNGVEITGWDDSQNRISVATATISGTYHYFPGETISLTAIPMGNGSATPTYQWYKGGTASGNAISGATSATYTKANCTYDDMGAYYCKVTWGGNAHWSDDGTAYNLKMLRLFVNGSRNGDPYGDVDFTKVDGTTATATINLGLLWTYGFSIGDGCGNYYGNTGSMTESNCTNWTMNSNVQCEFQTTNAADYTFTVNYSNLAAPVVSVTYPISNQAANKVIYFDNNVLKWTNVWYRIGRTNHSQANQMTKVSGTDNLYTVTTSKYDNFASWFVTNAQGGTGNNKSIYNTKNATAITAATQYIGDAVTASAVTVTPGSDHSTGGTSENNNCEFYSKTITTGMKTDRVTISSYSNGTITVNYVNTSNVASSFTSGYQDLAHTVILTSITAVANTGYDASAITINGGAYSANYVVTGATTVAASFTPHVYSITYKDQGNVAFSGTHATGYPTTHTYATATTLKSASKVGYRFDGWYTTSNCSGSPVTTLGATAYSANITLYAKWTLAWSVVGDFNSWAVPGTHVIDHIETAGGNTTGYVDITLSARTTYEMKLYDLSAGSEKYVGRSDEVTTPITYANSGSANALNTYGGYNFFFRTAGAGTYRFTRNFTTGTLTITYPTSYSVTYDGNGSTGGTLPATEYYSSGETVTVAAKGTLAKTNYTFDGWNTTANISGTARAAGSTFTMPASNTTLYAKWTQAVTLNQNNATTSGTTSVTMTYFSASHAAIANPSRTGYTFDGWNTKADGTGYTVINIDGTLRYNSSVTYVNSDGRWTNGGAAPTLYAKWNPISYTVTLNDDSGSGGSGTVAVTYDATTNLTTSVTKPTKSGYTFAGYYTAQGGGGTQLIDNNGAWIKSVSGYTGVSGSYATWKYDDDITLYAKWTQNITLNQNGATTNGTTSLAATYNAVLSASGITNPSKTNYTFAGWTTAKNSGSVVINASKVVQTVSNWTDGSKKWIHAGTSTLYAKWTENTHTVTIAVSPAAGGSTNVSSVTGVGVATASGTITATASPGYYFTGWTIPSGVTLASGTTSSASITINATAGGATVTAGFAPIWRIAGGDVADSGNADEDALGNWSTTANQITNITTSAGVMTSGTVTVNLDANTEYSFKVFNASNNHWWGNSGTITKIIYTNRTTNTPTLSDNTGNDQTFRSAAKGTYTFTWNVSSSTITITYPTSYKISISHGYWPATNTIGASSNPTSAKGGTITSAVASVSGTLAVNGTSGDQYVGSGESVTFTHSTAASGWAWYGWGSTFNNSTHTITPYTNGSGGATINDASRTLTLANISANKSVYGFFRENRTTITVDAEQRSHGTLKISSTSKDWGSTVDVGVYTHPWVEATGAAGYMFTSWTKTGQTQVVSGQLTDKSIQIGGNGTNGTTGTLTAHFDAYGYVVRGSLYDESGNGGLGGWDAMTTYLVPNGDGTGTYTATLNRLTRYKFKVYFLENYWWGTSETSDISGGTTYTLTGGNNDITFTTTAAGTYTFTYNYTTHAFTLTYPTAYTVTYYGNGSTSGSVPTDATPYASGETVNVLGNTGSLTKTDYTLSGWNTDEHITGTTYGHAGGASFTITANTNLYAKWTHAISLDREGGTGASTVTATYNSSTLTDWSAPTKTGYTFGGYYTGDNGTGTLVISTSGVLQAGVSGYTGAGGIWTSSTARTLYAKWTPIPYTIRFLNYDGTVLQTGSVNYDETPVYSGSTPTKPTDATYTYTFTGWSPTIASVTGAQDYTAQYSTTDNVASVSFNGGSPTYYTTLADAIDAAKGGDKALVTILKDILDLPAAVTYNPGSTYTCTLDLNGHTVQGAINTYLIYVSKKNAVFEVKDGGTGGKLHNEASKNGRLYCIYVNSGHLKILSGTVYCKNTYASGSSRYSHAVGSALSGNAKLTMTGGTVKAEAPIRAYALFLQGNSTISGGSIIGESDSYAGSVYSYGTTNISGGAFSATATSSNHAYGIRVARGTTEITNTNSPEFTVTAVQYAYGVYAGEAPLNTGTLNDGHAIIRGGTYTVTTTTPATSTNTYAIGVYANAAGVNGKSGYEGNYASAGTIDVYDGTFDVTAYSYVYGIVSKGTITQSQDGYEDATATPKVNIYGGKFKMTKTSGSKIYAVVATSATITNEDVVIEGGYYNINTNLASYTAPTKSCNYHVFNPTDLPTYPYKVAEGYTLTWDLDGGTVTTAGTGAAVDATGTPNIVVEVGASITAPTVTKTGYTFNVWSPIVASTMPAAATTYTATWTPNTNTAYKVKHYQQKLDGTYPSTPTDTDSKTGTTGTSTAAASKSYTGFTADPFSQATIAADGSTVVSIYYTRNAYTLTWDANGGTITGDYTSGSVKYGATITAPANANVTRENYEFADWNTTPAATMPAANTTYTAQWNAAVASVTTGGNTTYYSTVTGAFTAANAATAAVTITMLSNASVTAPLEYNNSNTQNCTLDLNGYTITSTTSSRFPLQVNSAGVTFTITDGTVGKAGKLSMTSSMSDATIFGAWANTGNLVLEAGTIEVISSTHTTAGATAGTNGTFTMNGGTIHVQTSNSKVGYGTYYNGVVTINDGTIHVEAAGNAYGVKYAGEGTSPSATVNGGKFNISGATAYATDNASNITIEGGWYTTNNHLASRVSAPYHVFNLDDATYNYEVAEGYTLTWTTDGDPLTGTYTNGTTKIGTTIVQPNTPTKTGYTFSAWSPAPVASTMPAADTEYTATWTANTNTAYQVKHYKQKLDGTYAASPDDTDNLTGTTGASVTPARKSYTGFTAPSGTTVTIAADGSTVVTYQYTRKSYTLTWSSDGDPLSGSYTTGSTKYEAPITAPNTPTKTNYVFAGWNNGSGVVTPATTMPASALTYTATWTAAVASVTAGGITTYYTTVADAITAANGKSSPTVTMLQNASVENEVTITAAMTINLNGKTITSTLASATGVFKINASGKTVIIRDGSTGGTIAHTASYAGKLYGINIVAGSLTLQSGTIYATNNVSANDNYRAYGIYTDTSASLITISGGTVSANSKNMSFGIYTNNTCNLTMTGGTITSNATTKARGIYVKGTTSLSGATITATATGENSYAVYGKSGSLTISSGTYTASGTGTAHAVGEEAGTLTISGGRFNGATKELYKAGGTASITGGYYVHNTDIESNCATGYHVLPASLTEGGVTYNYKVAQAYTLTWNLAGGSISSAGTADGYVEVGATVTAPTVTKTGYNFTGWSPAVPSTMPASNTTCVAQWSAATYTVTLDRNSGTTGATSVTMTYNSNTMSGYSAPSKLGHNFAGYWTHETDNNGDGTLVIDTNGQLQANVEGYTGENGVWIKTTATTLYAKWLDAFYHITFWHNGNGSIAVGGKTVAAGGTAIVYHLITRTLEATPNTGYHFTGWTVTGADKDNVVIGNTSAASTTIRATGVSASTATVTANFVPNVYTITYKDQGGADFSGVHGDGYPTSHTYGTATALVSPTKTGYTFGGWYTDSGCTGSVVTSLGATTYTANITLYAKWTINSYTIRFLNYDGTVLQTGSVNYGETPVYSGETPTKPTDATYTYTFNGWSPAIASVTGAQDYTAQFSSTGNVASVHVGAGAKSYFTTLADAVDDAETKDNAVITVLDEISGIATALTYDAAKTCTLDLNNHTVAGTVDKLLTINNASANFTITDNSGAKGGVLKTVVSANARVYCVYLTAGTVNMNNGKVYCQNTHTYSSATENKSTAASAVYVTAGQTFIMNNGTVESEAQRASYAIYAVQGTSTITINNGYVYGHTNSSAYACGIYNAAKTLTVNGGHIVGHSKVSYSYGIFLYGGDATINGGTIEATNDATTGTTTAYGIYVQYVKAAYRAQLTIPSTSTVSVSAVARTNTAFAVYVYSSSATVLSNGATIEAGTFTAQAKTGYTANGIRTSGGNVTVSGGTFTVSAATPSSVATASCGVFSLRGKITVNSNPTFNVSSGDTRAYGACAYGTIGDKGTADSKFSGDIEINGGTFNVTTTKTTAYGALAGIATKTVAAADGNVAGTHYMPGNVTINGGTFNVTATTNTAYGVYVSEKQAESGDVGTTVKRPTMTVTGGKFKMTSTGDATKAYAMNTAADNTDLLVRGGYYSTKKTGTSTNIESKYTHSGMLTSEYRVFPISPALEDKYNFKVARFYTITYNAGTGASGTVAEGYKEDGVDFTLSSSTFTRTGYTQSGWSTSDGGTKAYNLGGTYTDDADITLYPFWGEDLHTINVVSGGNGTVTPASVSGVGITTASGDITATAATGYHFDNWTLPDDIIAATGYTSSSNPIHINATVDGTITANFAPNTNTAYTVNHYKQNVDGSYPTTPTETDHLTGTTGASVTPSRKSYGLGFTAPASQTVTIAADGSTVVNYQYTRNSFTLTWNLGGGKVTTAGTCAPVNATGTPSGDVKYEASITTPVVAKSGCTFVGWSTNGSTVVTPATTMPAAARTYTALWIGTTSITGTVKLTASAGEKVATGTAEITISSDDFTNAHALRITYRDVTNNITYNRDNYTSSEFRLCNASYNIVDNSNISLSGVSGSYSQTFSITYQPNGGANTLDHYQLVIEVIRSDNSAIETKTLDLYGRTLPSVFAIATKIGGSWYALPNNMSSGSAKYDPILISVTEDANVLNWSAQGPSTVGYIMRAYSYNSGYAKMRFAANAVADADKHCLWAATGNAYGIKNDSPTSTDDNYAWIATPDENFNVYSMSNDANTRTGLMIDGDKWGMYNSGYGEIHFIPLTTVETIDIIPREWKANALIYSIRDGNATTAAKYQVGSVSETAATLTKLSTGGYGLYKVDVCDLTSHYGEVMTLKLTVSGNIKYAYVTVPIIVNSNMSTSTSSPFKDMTKEVSAGYDVVVLGGYTLTTNASSTKACKFHDLYIYPGAKLDNSENGNLALNSLELRAGIPSYTDLNGELAAPNVYLDKAISSCTNGAHLDMYVDVRHDYGMSVPFAVNTANVKYANALNANTGAAINGTLNSHFRVSYYSAEQRATTGKGWVDITSSTDYPTLNPGTGYVVQGKRPSGQPLAVLRFPFTDNPTTWATTTGEKEKSAINISGYGVGESTISDNNKGWNLIANPYSAKISYETHAEEASFIGNITVGYLEKEYKDGNWTGKYVYTGSSNAYVTMPNDNYTVYTQNRANAVAFEPYKNFFVQAKTNTGSETVTFNRDYRQKAPAYLLAPIKVTKPLFVDIDLTHGTNTVTAGLTIDKDAIPGYFFMEDENIFENHSDLNYLKLYTIADDHYLVGNTMTPDELKQLIPVEFYAPDAESNYVFKMHDGSDIDNIESLYLFDTKENVQVDLLQSDYEFTVPAAGFAGNRFYINVTLKEETNVQTDINNADSEIAPPIKFLYQDKVYILYNGLIYDATGKKALEINK